MADAHPPSLNECREPTPEDLVKLCRALNDAGARYVVVGGFAIRAAGFIRNTMDVDLPDRLFLRALLEQQGIQLEPHRDDTVKPQGWLGWLAQLFGVGKS